MRKTSVSIYDTKELLESWDYKSNTLDPKITSNKSSQKAWWICKKCGASYERGIKEQKKSMGLCKVCTAKETANRVYLSNLRNRGSVKTRGSLVLVQGLVMVKYMDVGNVASQKALKQNRK